MPYKIPDVVTKEFRLTLIDDREGIPEEEATKVIIKTAAGAENSARSDLFSSYTQEIPKDELAPERIIIKLPLYALQAKEVFLTLVGCNIEIPDKDGGTRPLFKFRKSLRGPELNMTEGEFIKAWGLLSDDVMAEIHSKVLEMNPHWIFNPGQTDLGEG